MVTTSLHVSGARIWTGDPARPWAGSVTIEDGRVAALDALPGRLPVIEAGGRIALPGLIDAHVHLLMGGLAMDMLDMAGVRTRAGFEQAIAERHQALPPGTWLVASGLDRANWPSGDRPHITWLASAGDRPVACWGSDLHAVLVNHPVLAQCLPREAEAAAAGGCIERDDAGQPTGLLLEEAAMRLVPPLVPGSGVVARRDAILRAQSHAHSLGLTAVGSMESPRDVVDVFEPLRETLTLRCLVTLMERGEDAAEALSLPRDDRLAVIGRKAFLDGTLGSRTARMIAPYADDPGNRGMLIDRAADGTLESWAQETAAMGLSPAMHAIGDEAVAMALDVAARVGPGCRPRIEHAEVIADEDYKRLDGVILSVQPRHRAEDALYLARALGAERLARVGAYRRCLDHGARLAFGSDWPVVTLDPLVGIQAAVTGRSADGTPFHPEQAITVPVAFAASTAGAAAALGLEGGGVLREGSPGDLVLLDDDPFTHDWTVRTPSIILTLSGGTVVHASDDSLLPPDLRRGAHA